MSHPSTLWSAVLAVLLVGCDADPSEPLDGGYPLDLHDRGGAGLKPDPCLRREKTGWHYSVGHCLAMAPMERMSGVWVTAFEESGFIPGATTIPDPNDPRRFAQELELDDRKIVKLTGPTPMGGHSYHGEAYLVTFVGRRTSDPYGVGCDGIPQFSVVVDRLMSARHLGPLGPGFSIEALQSRPVTVTRRHEGKWGELEQEAMEKCAKRKARQTGNS
jgi:hypothetical protein